MKSRVTQAYPCSPELPFGLHDVVLVKREPGVPSTYANLGSDSSSLGTTGRYRTSESDFQAQAEETCY